MAGVSSQAGVAPLSIDEVAGFWRITDGGRGFCEIALSPLSSGGAYGVSIEKCSLHRLAKARTWHPVAAGFELLDDGGTMIVRFDRTGADAFIARDDGYSVERALS